MDVDLSSKFGIVDYSVFAVMMAVSGGIGLYNSIKGNKSPEEFFMGNRNFNSLPVAMSFLTSFVSAISLLGFSGEAYAYGIQIAMFTAGSVLAILFIIYFTLPVLYPLKLTSVNEYIELRFKSKRLRLVVSVLSFLRVIIYMGVCLYAPTIALVSVTKLNNLTYILLFGVVCTFYSAFGGIRAVIWTDVFQLTVILLGLILVVTIGFVQNGGLVKTWYISSEAGRLDLFNMDLSPFTRHTFLNTLVNGFFLSTYIFGTDQIYVQRTCSVKIFESAKRVLLYNIFGMVFIYFLIFSGGLIAFAAYERCDPMALGIIERQEQILPFYVTDKMGLIPGLPGIFVATLTGGTLSSLSSVINACVAMVWRDICLRFPVFNKASARFATITNIILSIIFGLTTIGLAVAASYGKSLVEFINTITSVFMGPILGVFLIGFFLPRCNIKGVWTGIILSSALTMWIVIGGLLFKQRQDLLPFSSDHCDEVQFSTFNISELQNSFSIKKIETSDSKHDGSFIEPIYHLSYTIYTVFGTMLCIVSAFIVSYLTGFQSIDETSPELISPIVRKFYWTKDKLINLENTNIFLNNFHECELEVNQNPIISADNAYSEDN